MVRLDIMAWAKRRGNGGADEGMALHLERYDASPEYIGHWSEHRGITMRNERQQPDHDREIELECPCHHKGLPRFEKTPNTTVNVINAGNPEYSFLGLLRRSYCYRCSSCGRLLRLLF